MELTFVAKDTDSVPDSSPALYRTEALWHIEPGTGTASGSHVHHEPING
jgi:hypothetical protein